MASSEHTAASSTSSTSSSLNGGDIIAHQHITTNNNDDAAVDASSIATASSSSSTTSTISAIDGVDGGVPLAVTRIATIGYTVATGEWIEEDNLLRPLKDTPTDISICIDARKEKVKNDFLQKQDQLSDEDKQFIRDTKERKKRQGKKALWALTWCDEQKRKTLPELWQKAKESNITHDLSQVKLVVRRNVLNSLANMLYTKESDQKHGHKYEHPQEYCVEKRDGTLFLDVIRSNYELREWRFGRDILGKAMENAFIANTDIELYNTLIIQGKGDIQVGITADFGYTDIDGSPCELSPISSDRVKDEKRILNSWIRAKLGGIAKITKVVYDRAPGKPITITEIVTDVAEVVDGPPSFPGFDALFDTLGGLVALAAAHTDGTFYTTYRSGTGFTELTPERREDTRKSRFLNHAPRGGFYGGGRGGFHHHRQDHLGGRGGRQPIHHQHHHHQQQQPHLFYQPPLSPEPSIYIRNLPFDTTREELIEFFTMNNCKVKDLFIHFDPPTGRPKGSAIVDFYDFESFSLALGLSGQQVKGRSIEVKIARKFPPMHATIPTPDPRGVDRPEDLWDRGKRPDQRGVGPAGVGAHPPPGAGAIPAPYHAGYPPPAYRVGPPRGYAPHGFAPGIVPMGYYPAPHERSYRGGRGRGGNWVPNQRGHGRAPHYQQQQHHHHIQHHHGAHQQLQQVPLQPELLQQQQQQQQQVPTTQVPEQQQQQL